MAAAEQAATGKCLQFCHTFASQRSLRDSLQQESSVEGSFAFQSEAAAAAQRARKRQKGQAPHPDCAHSGAQAQLLGHWGGGRSQAWESACKRGW